MNSPANKKIWILVGAALVTGIAAYAVSGWLARPVVFAPQAEEKMAAVRPQPQVFTLAFDFGSGEKREFKDVALSEGQNLFDVMRAELKKENVIFLYAESKSMGVFISQIGDKKNGAGSYWQFWVNGKYSQVGASSYIPKPNDLVEWRFTGNKSQ